MGLRMVIYRKILDHLRTHRNILAVLTDRVWCSPRPSYIDVVSELRGPLSLVVPMCETCPLFTPTCPCENEEQHLSSGEPSFKPWLLVLLCRSLQIWTRLCVGHKNGERGHQRSVVMVLMEFHGLYPQLYSVVPGLITIIVEAQADDRCKLYMASDGCSEVGSSLREIGEHVLRWVFRVEP